MIIRLLDKLDQPINYKGLVCNIMMLDSTVNSYYYIRNGSISYYMYRTPMNWRLSLSNVDLTVMGDNSRNIKPQPINNCRQNCA